LALSKLDFPARSIVSGKGGSDPELYPSVWQGQPLGPEDFVLCADEKPSIQARRRKHPSLPPAPALPTRIEYEYERKGAWVYLAAWDIRRAKIFGRCAHRNGIQRFDGLIGEVMDQEP